MLRALLFALGAAALGFQIGVAILLVTYRSRSADAIEALCVRGQITHDQAQALNGTLWLKVPGYCTTYSYVDDYGMVQRGESPCLAQQGDRIVSAACSQALKSLFSGD